jgi:hypothetical protein
MATTAPGTPIWLNRVLRKCDLGFGAAVRGLLDTAFLAA